MSIPNAFDPMGNRGFTRVEYLQSTGIQWIDTGIKPSEFDEFEIEFCVLREVRNCGNYFGVDDNVNANEISQAVTAYTAGYSTFWFACGDNESSFASIYSLGMKARYRLSANKAILTTDNGSLTCNKGGSFVDVPMHLFRANGAAKDTPYKDTGLQIFYAWFKKDGNLLAHFVPAVDPKGVACMLELVSGVPFYNQGTGEFIIGPRI